MDPISLQGNHLCPPPEKALPELLEMGEDEGYGTQTDSFKWVEGVAMRKGTADKRGPLSRDPVP